MDVRLEPWGEDDLPLLRRLVGDPVMMGHLGGAEPPEKVAERQARYVAPGSGSFKVVDTATGDGVGWVGAWARTWRDEPIGEVGWSVLPAAQGRGVATRATAALSTSCGGRGSTARCTPSRRSRTRRQRRLRQGRLRAARRGHRRVPAGPRAAVQRLAARARPLGSPTWRRTWSTSAAVAHARELIDARQYVLRSDWGDAQPRAEQENAYLEHHGGTTTPGGSSASPRAPATGRRPATRSPTGLRRVHRMGLIAASTAPPNGAQGGRARRARPPAAPRPRQRLSAPAAPSRAGG